MTRSIHQEHCAACAMDTPHSVRIEVRTESRKQTNVEFSREPYRIAICERCGDERTLRMNNA